MWFQAFSLQEPCTQLLEFEQSGKSSASAREPNSALCVYLFLRTAYHWADEDISTASENNAGELDRLIHERAYEIWLEEGQPYGKDKEHWARAKKEILGSPEPLIDAGEGKAPIG